jgi:glucose-6-phosphate 1-dehydrogenase
MNSCTFVILGATGDLTRRKLIPAIYRLIKDKKIKKFVLVGVALPRTSIGRVLEKSREFIKKIDKTVWKRLQKHSYYRQLDFYKAASYLKLKKFLLDLEKEHKLPGNHLFYLATMPEHFETITKNLSESGIVKKDSDQKNWTRVVYEKPLVMILSRHER